MSARCVVGNSERRKRGCVTVASSTLWKKPATHCAGTPGHLWEMMHHPQAMPASPMTPVMRHQQQQQSQYASSFQGSVTQHLSPGGLVYDGQLGTPQPPSMPSPQSNARFSAHAASPGSNQPYTCYVCNATATSRKNYIAHLQVSYTCSVCFTNAACRKNCMAHLQVSCLHCRQGSGHNTAA